MKSELVAYGLPKYRAMQKALDDMGIPTCILKIGKRKYQWIVNYEVKGEYVLRRTCNVRLTKLYKENIDNGSN